MCQALSPTLEIARAKNKTQRGPCPHGDGALDNRLTVAVSGISAQPYWLAAGILIVPYIIIG